jgi:Peptidase family M28
MVDVDARRGGARARLALWSTLLAVLALAAFTWWMDAPPVPLPADAPSALFSAQRAAARLEGLVGTGQPHPLASAADARIRGQLVAELRALGIPTELQGGWACDITLACGWVVNVIGRIAGTEPDSGAVLLASHYDSVPAGPGAGDDGVGVASVLEIARALRQQAPPRHPIILLIDEGEEAGLLGARLFVAEHPSARTVRAVVNLDARGDSGPSLMFETGPATDWTLRLYARAVARPMSNSLYYFIYKLLPNDTDFTVFKAAGYEGLNYALIGDVERYHTPQDNLANLDLRSLQHQGQNALASVQALAAARLDRPGTQGAVFFDFMGRTLVHWPASWSVPVGIALALALLFALGVVKRRARLGAGELFHAFTAWLVAWLVVIGATVALLSLARAIGAVPPAAVYSWAAHPSGLHAASLALALLAPALAVRLSRRRAGPWSLWIVQALVLGALALLCCLRFPEPSFVFLLPALAMLLAAWPAASAARRAAADGVPTFVVVLPLLVTTLVFAPILLLLYPGLGADAWPVLTAVAALGLMGLAPLLRQAQSPDFRAWGWLGVLVIVLGGALTIWRPAYSTQMPQRTLLWYLLDADTGRARWMLQPDSKRAPPQLALRGPEGASAASLPAGTITGLHVAAAPQLDYAPPELQVLDAAAVDGGSVHRLRLRSVRGAPEIELALPDGQATAATLIGAGGRRLPVKPWRAADHSLWLQFIGAPAEGVELELETPGADHLVVTLLDRSYGLPAAGAALRHPGPALTTASQSGDLTVVYRSYALGRPQATADP